MATAGSATAAVPAAAKKRAIRTLGAVTQQLESTRMSEAPGGAAAAAAAAAAPTSAVAHAAQSQTAAAACSSAAAASASSSSAAAAPSAAPAAAPPSAAPAAAPPAAVPSARPARSPPLSTANFYVPPNRRASSGGASPAPAASPPIEARGRSDELTQTVAPAAPSAAALSAAPAAAASSRPPLSPSPSPSHPPASSSSASSSAAPAAPVRKGLILDRDRQAAIDAQFGMGAEAAGASSVSEAQVLEAYNLEHGTKAQALQLALGTTLLRVLPGVQEGSLLLVFSTERAAAAALDNRDCMFRLRSMQDASDATRAEVANIAAPESASSRPPKSSSAALRLISGSLGLRMPRQSPAVREEERKAKEERRRKQDEARARKESGATGDAWDD